MEEEKDWHKIKAEIVNSCIATALRVDEEYRMMILLKLTQKLTDENYLKLVEHLSKENNSWKFKFMLHFCNHLNSYAGLEDARFDFMLADFLSSEPHAKTKTT